MGGGNNENKEARDMGKGHGGGSLEDATEEVIKHIHHLR